MAQANREGIRRISTSREKLLGCVVEPRSFRVHHRSTAASSALSERRCLSGVRDSSASQGGAGDWPAQTPQPNRLCHPALALTQITAPKSPLPSPFGACHVGSSGGVN